MRALPLRFLALALPIALPACDSADLASLDPQDDPRSLDAGLIEWLGEFGRTVEEKDLEGYLALLHEDFEFLTGSFITWADGDSWGKAEERIIMENFFEPGWIPWDDVRPTDPIHAVNHEEIRSIEVNGSDVTLSLTLILDYGTGRSLSGADLGFVVEPGGRWILRTWRFGGRWSRRDGYYTLPNMPSSTQLGRALRTVHARRDVESYRLLLTDEALAGEFRFHPRPEDLDAMPWVTDGSWDLDEELGMLERFFAGTATPDGVLVFLDVYIEHVASSIIEEGRRETLFRADVTLRRDLASTLAFTTFLTFDVRIDETDQYRIHQIWESTPPGWSAPSSWGLELAAVRDPARPPRGR